VEARASGARARAWSCIPRIRHAIAIGCRPFTRRVVGAGVRRRHARRLAFNLDGDLLVQGQTADMTEERRIVAELAARLKVALDGVRAAERRLATMGAEGTAGEPWDGVIDRVRSIIDELSLMRRIVNISWLRTVGRSPLAS
jgi:hypothetical protein